MAGLREIAQASGVSMSAVSDILNRGREDKYRPETRERVLAAIEELGYQPDRTAQSMRTRRTRVIGFVAPNLTTEGRLENATVYPFLVGLSHGLTPYGYHAALVELDEIESDKGGNGLPPVLQERFFDALVLQHGMSEAAIRLTEHAAVPILRWDSNNFDSHNCLRRDERAVTREALERLYDLGHRRIAYMVGGLRWERYQAGLQGDHYSYADRYETYCACVRERNDAPLIITEYSLDTLRLQLETLKPTAVIAPEMDGARALIDAAQTLGWRIPQDVTVATLDREVSVRSVGRQIGGVAYDRLSVGRRAADLIRQILEKNQPIPSISSHFGDWALGETIAARVLSNGR